MKNGTDSSQNKSPSSQFRPLRTNGTQCNTKIFRSAPSEHPEWPGYSIIDFFFPDVVGVFQDEKAKSASGSMKLIDHHRVQIFASLKVFGMCWRKLCMRPHSLNREWKWILRLSSFLFLWQLCLSKVLPKGLWHFFISLMSQILLKSLQRLRRYEHQGQTLGIY